MLNVLYCGFGVTYYRYTGSRNDLGQLFCNVCCHFIVLGIFWLSGIEIESGTGTKVPVGVFSWNSGAPWGSVWEQDGNVLSRSHTEKSALLRSGVGQFGFLHTSDKERTYPVSSVHVKPAR